MSQNGPEPAALKKDETTDVCIVGAGIAGLTTAYLLTCEGVPVIVLEKGEIGCGETERTTAHLATALDDRYIEVERIRGKDIALLAADAHTQAIEQIERICMEEKIDCGFERVEGRLMLADGEKEELLQKELQMVHELGLSDISLERSSAIRDFETGPYLRFPRQGQFHPMKYLHGLAKSIQKRGGKIFTQTRALKMEEKSGKKFINTENGPTVTAKHFVIATNAPTIDPLQLYLKYAPYRSYVIAAVVPKGSVERVLLWDVGDPYHYVRVQDMEGPNAQMHDMLIVGGEDHKTGQADDAEDRYEKLEAWARERFPMIEKIIHRWSGQVLETPDGLAFIGHKKDDPVYVATGDSGMGMTHGTIAGVLLTDLIQNRKNPWEEVFDPTRITGVGSLLSEGANVAKELAAGWLESGTVKNEKDLKTGHGAVLHEGLTTRIALYRDDKGTLHKFSAVCPHKGCIVQWNSGEKTWDCPCHGSRYTVDGEAVNAPTYADLSEKGE